MSMTERSPMSYLVSSFLLLFLLPSLELGPTRAVATRARHRNLVPKVCETAATSDPNVNYAFCVRALRSARGSRSTNIKGLAVIAVKLSRANATATRSHVKKLLKGKIDDGYQKNCLDDCKELYTDAASVLKDAKRAVRGERYGDAVTWLSSAADAATTCEQGFEDRPGTRNPLRKRNKDLFQLAVIALSIVNALAR